MSWDKKIKNRFKQLEKNNYKIQNSFPNSVPTNSEKFFKSWVAMIVVDIYNYKQIYENKDEYYVMKMILLFNEGVSSIMKQYKLQNIYMQEGSIYGFLPVSETNDENAHAIFECAMHINGFLNYLWRETFDEEFQMLITLDKEFLVSVGKNEDRGLFFVGNSLSESKKMINKSQLKNCILVSPSFEENNGEVLWNEEDNCSYISKEGKNFYSEWSYQDWED